MRLTAAIAVLPACLLGIWLVPSSEAHELYTKKGHHPIKHTHYTDQFHATDANNDADGAGKKNPGPPNPFHKFGFCVVRNPFTGQAQFIAARTVTLSDPGGLPEVLKKLKKDVEDFWASKFGSTWRDKVEQMPPTASGRTNCVGEAASREGYGDGGDNGWIDPEDALIMLADDYEPNPAGSSDDGCIVVYRAHNKDTGEVTHIAVVAEVGPDGKATKVISRLARIIHEPGAFSGDMLAMRSLAS